MTSAGKRLERALFLTARIQAIELAVTELKAELRAELREARDGAMQDGVEDRQAAVTGR